ncbi:MAG: hypothetical protein ACLFPE_05675 [Bacteroidales bacterium]
MATELSFLCHPVENLLRHVHTLVSGINRVDAVYLHQGVLRARRVLLISGRGLTEMLDLQAHIPSIEKLRKGKSAYNWFSPKEIPYHINDGTRKMGGMFDELEKVVLMLRIPNHEDQAGDLMFFYFAPDLRNFGPASTNSEITTAQKEIIAKSLVNAVQTIMNISASDRESWELFSQMTTDNRRKLQHLKKQFDEVSLRYEERLVDTCNYYLAGLAAKYGKNYAFGRGAEKLIREYKGDYFRIENAVTQAVKLANMLIPATEGETVEITEDLINFSAPEAADNLEEQIANSIYEKPYKYLNMLEEAAQRVRDNKIPVTSQHVADALQKPVKPPAITWSINKHMKNIQHLLKVYPEKWPVIRSEFKPILRITA